MELHSVTIASPDSSGEATDLQRRFVEQLRIAVAPVVESAAASLAFLSGSSVEWIVACPSCQCSLDSAEEPPCRFGKANGRDCAKIDVACQARSVGVAAVCYEDRH